MQRATQMQPPLGIVANFQTNVYIPETDKQPIPQKSSLIKSGGVCFMYRKRKHLPPLDFLIAFEAAAHLSSFTAAAKQLNLTQAAISRQIRLLEQSLDQKLFDRQHRSITLTQVGREFLPVASHALDHINNFVHDQRMLSDAPSIKIAATQSVSSFWLLPIVERYKTENPSFEIKLISSDDDNCCMDQDVDIAILLGNGSWPNHDATLLFKEEISPACTADYLSRHGPLRKLSDITNHTLIEVVENHEEWINWLYWLTEHDIDCNNKIKRISFNTYPLAVQAACDGLGLVLGWSHILEKKFQSGELIKPLDVSISTDSGYYLLTKSDMQLNPYAQGFHDWISQHIPLKQHTQLPH